MADDEKTIKAKLKFETDQASAKSAEDAIKKVGQSGVAEQVGLQKEFDKTQKMIDKLGQSAEKASQKTEQNFAKMRELGEKTRMVGTTMLASGAAIASPFLLALNAYVSKTGEAEETSSRWQGSMERISEAQIRVGRVTTEAILPVMEKVADLAEWIAAETEKHPELIQAALAVAATLAGGGIILGALGQAASVYSAIAMIATTGPATIATLGTLVTTLGPLALAITALVALLSTEFGQQGVTAGKQILTMGAMDVAGIGALIQGKDHKQAMAEAYQSFGRFIGLIADDTEKAALKIKKSDEIIQKQIDIYGSYKDSETQETVQYQKQRQQIIAQAVERERTELEDFNRQKSTTLRDFFQSEKRTEESYYADRLKKARDAGIAETRAEEDHQRDIQRLRRSYQDTASDLIGARDAVGLIKATRDYERARSDSDEDFSTSQKRQREDYALQLADEAQQFATERAQRLADFTQRVADEQEQFDLRRQREQDNTRKQIADLDSNYVEERNKKRAAMIQQLKDLDEGNAAYRNALRADYQLRINDLLSVEGGGNLPGRASGGYMGGVYRTSEKGYEFALSHSTTVAAERVAGQRLDQQTLLNLITGGKSLVYNDHRRITGSVSAEERRALRRDVDDLLAGAFS